MLRFPCVLLKSIHFIILGSSRIGMQLISATKERNYLLLFDVIYYNVIFNCRHYVCQLFVIKGMIPLGWVISFHTIHVDVKFLIKAYFGEVKFLHAYINKYFGIIPNLILKVRKNTNEIEIYMYRVRKVET